MPRIHQITHDSELVKQKVNFFADYFAFAAETIGTNDFIEIDNALSLTDKLLFQVTQNINHCPKYIDSYLTHKSFEANYEEFKDDKIFKKFQSLIKTYKDQGKSGQKIKWIQAHPEFTKTIEQFGTALKRTLFKKALNAIISYLRCVHEIDVHKEEIFNQTDVIISELILNDRSKKDIGMVFERIMTREIGRFPFPNSLKSPEEKENFIKNRTFQQQFDGIYNLLKEPLSKNHFLFRVYGLKTPDDFEFTYNRVTFYNPKNLKLAALLNNAENVEQLKDFLGENEYLLLATIKAEYSSIDVATNGAIELIHKELQFINRVFNGNCTLEKFSYLLTPNFIDVGWHRNGRENGFKVIDEEINRLKDNPYVFLRKSPKSLKDPLLKNEYIYSDALINKNVATYWQYLETIIPTKSDDDKQVIDIVSHLLMLNAESHYKNRIRSYIINAVSPFVSSARHLGITTERQLEIFKDLTPIDWKQLKNEIKHPFILYLISEYLRVFKKQDFMKMKSFYERVLWDCQAQRNAIIHRGYAQDKAMKTLSATLPRLINRLRWVLFEGIKSKNGNDYESLVYNLKDKAVLLIRK